MAPSRTLVGSVPVAWRSFYRLWLPAASPPSAGHPVLLGLHGAGDNGARLCSRLGALRGGPYAGLFPDAPFPVEVRGVDPPRVGFTWYQYTGDQEAFSRALDFGEAWLMSLLQAVASEHPVDARRVVMLGHSQGGYLGSVAALRSRSRFRGLVAIACRIKTEILEQELRNATGYPVLAIHGQRDPMTPLGPQRDACAVLQGHGLNVCLRVHPGGHGISRKQLAPIDDFVRRALGLASS